MRKPSTEARASLMLDALTGKDETVSVPSGLMSFYPAISWAAATDSRTRSTKQVLTLTSDRTQHLAEPLYVAHRFPHHSTHGGYDQIVRYLPKGRVISGPAHLARYVATLGDRLPRLRNRAIGVLEIDVVLALLVTRRRLFHFVYAENTYSYAGFFKDRGANRVVATLHQPPAYLDRMLGALSEPRRLRWIANYRRADAIIVLGENLRRYVADLVGAERVHVVPHGVDITHFRPPLDPTIRRDDRCLVVGNWLRDFRLAAEVASACLERFPCLRFRVVSESPQAAALDGLPNVDRLPRLSEMELLAEYQTATLLFQPVLDSVANNAALEAQACGLPLVATDVGAMREYVSPSAGHFIPPGDPGAALAAIGTLLNDSNLRHAYGQAAREWAARFDWRRVAAETTEVYRQAAGSAQPIRGPD